MATRDPFDFIQQTKVSRETVASLEGREGQSPEDETPKRDPFDFVASGPKYAFRENRPDIGVKGSFTSGVGRGLVEPFSIITGGPESDPRIDEGPEKVSEFLGSMVGLGISFVPFVAGTGLAMKGVGLAAKLSPEIHNFIKFTVAGAAQFAGTSEELEDVPKNALAGLVFGGAIEGLFLTRAMRARKGLVNRNKALPDGDPIPDVPIPGEQLGLEVNLAPNAGKSAARMEVELNGMVQENVSLNQVLMDLAENVETTVRIPNLANTAEIIAHTKAKLPNAQILTRKRLGGRQSEILVHNPIDPEDLLTPKQIAQYQVDGTFEGLEVIYTKTGKIYEATGIPAREGRIQIRDPNNKGRVFAPERNDVTISNTPRVFSERGNRIRTLQAAATEASTKVGFVIPSARGAGLGRRGFVDIEEFSSVSSYKAFLKENAEAIGQIEAGSVDEAVQIFAAKRGIPGLVARDSGIITDVRIFDQSKLTFVKEPPRKITAQSVGGELGESVQDFPTVGVALDNARVSVDAESGQILLHQFTPSWKNGIIPALRNQGVPEKEIQSFLDMHSAQLQQNIRSLMDDEFKALDNSSRAQFFEGCL